MNNELAHYCKGECAFRFTQTQQETISFLKDLFLPFTSKVYIVGGYVRDQLLKHDNHNDIDIEVFGVNTELFEQLMEQIGAIGVGKSFFVYKYKDIDISLPRTETKTGYGHCGFEVSLAKDEKVAAKRRDFTMNAMMVNIYTNKLYDFYNGLEHIKAKKISVIDKQSFAEDSLRVLRAMRFAAQFGFKIENESKKVMQKISLDDLSVERIANEFEKMFNTKYLHYALFYLFSLNIASQVFNTDIDLKTFFKLYRFFYRKRKYFNDQLYPYYFLYILNSFISIDINKLQLSKKFTKIILSQPKIDFDITVEKLYIIALDIPIENWLGCLDDNLINKAKKIDIYTNKLQTNIISKDIIDDGFKKDEIKKEIYRRKIKFIHDKISKT